MSASQGKGSGGSSGRFIPTLTEVIETPSSAQLDLELASAKKLENEAEVSHGALMGAHPLADSANPVKNDAQKAGNVSNVDHGACDVKKVPDPVAVKIPRYGLNGMTSGSTGQQRQPFIQQNRVQPQPQTQRPVQNFVQGATSTPAPETVIRAKQQQPGDLNGQVHIAVESRVASPLLQQLQQDSHETVKTARETDQPQQQPQPQAQKNVFSGEKTQTPSSSSKERNLFEEPQSFEIPPEPMPEPDVFSPLARNPSATPDVLRPSDLMLVALSERIAAKARLRIEENLEQHIQDQIFPLLDRFADQLVVHIQGDLLKIMREGLAEATREELERLSQRSGSHKS